MTARSTEAAYGDIARRLHWASVGLTVIVLTLGLAMTRVAGGDTTILFRIHVGLGLLLTAATVVRIGWRLRDDPPPAPPMPRWRRIAYDANHYGLYLGLLALGATGVALLLASDLNPIPTAVDPAEIEESGARDAHFLLALAYVGLFGMHVIGVITYQRSKGEVLSRMGVKLPARFDRTSEAEPS